MDRIPLIGRKLPRLLPGSCIVFLSEAMLCNWLTTLSLPAARSRILRMPGIISPTG